VPLYLVSSRGYYHYIGHKRSINTMKVHCDKCGVAAEKSSGNILFGEHGNICCACHSFKHELMEDPDMNEICAFCKDL